MSVNINPENKLDRILQDKFISLQKELIDTEKKYYSFCLLHNIAKEQARCVLSEGLTKTRLYMNGTLRSWIHYIQIRTDSATTQKEHCDVAVKIAEEIEKVFPMIREFVCVRPDVLAVSAESDNAAANLSTTTWFNLVEKFIGHS